MQAVNSGTGAMITGTLEMVEARADISNVRRDADGTLRYDHDGETTVFYDSMETQKSPAGENLFLDTAGDTVPEHQVALLTPEKAAGCAQNGDDAD